ncbi:bifunctional hydroxymethylpyrimidine kinase/phosphomethylpyrimidine kinase [Sphingomonas quercus]|uniref:hydroxymethylpyrimidine kinase n=1 Tax=Sphingomonas quercus TaxID=2842451 RepID=A0ABS6BDW5_9SPHN|nr:bifunctional hydroxymethylpyrimidine kinase/phosphomethylpyrimidine kinase [Sphingomonas quercus]MBU3076505.1 bifunctional hydroxymethylpyrimidine kinase/phosphomethylpyrimidine kinase [Sphingomonas quercus]
MTIPRVLVIAGSDSGGGAGIQADIKTITMLGGHATTAITAITAQNTLGVTDVHAVPTAMVLAQIDAVLDDIGTDAVKIGMIGSARTAHALAERLAGLDVPIVLDPVMVATSGDMLADRGTIDAFARLLDIATIATPNAPELAALTGQPVTTMDEAVEAGKLLVARHGHAVVVKGGHIEAEFAGVPVIRDVLITTEGERAWSSARIDTVHTHGTGCTLASGIAAGLAAGLGAERSVSRARAYLRRALRVAPELGQGSGPMGHALGVVPFDVIMPMEAPGRAG